MKKKQVKTLKVNNPDLIRLLCGPQNRYFGCIETALDVLIEAPGDEVIVSGRESNLSRAVFLLQSLYERIEAGETITEKDVDLLVRNSLSKNLSSSTLSNFYRETLPLKGLKKIAARTPGQEAYIQALKKNELVFGIGPAGTGKTFLAVSYGISELLSGRVSRLVIARPAVEAGENLGFLPGDMTDKVQPYLQPIWDALYTVMGKENAERYREKGLIEVAPLAFMRGRTLSDAYIVIDEAQNATQLQMRMVLTRLGESARMVVTGDITQIDLPRPQESGLEHAARLLQSDQDISIIRLTILDVVRHALVARIIKAYEADKKTGRV